MHLRPALSLTRFAGLLAASLIGAGPAYAIFGDADAHKRLDEQARTLQSLAEQMRAVDARVGGVESTAASNAKLLDLLNQIDALNAEIARLRGELETANNRLESADKRIRDLYIDIDGRLRVLETPAVAAPLSGADAGAGAGAAASMPPAPPLLLAPSAVGQGALPDPSGPAGASGSSGASGAAESRPAPAVSTGLKPTLPTAPAPIGAPRALAPSAGLPAARPGSSSDIALETAAYDLARNTHKEGRYLEAAGLFQQFIADHPSSPMAAPAQYWVGDALYNAKDYAGAISAQKRLIETWPGSAKVPDAMLNMASALRDSGDVGGERRTLELLINRHPASEAAEKARKRLTAKR